MVNGPDDERRLLGFRDQFPILERTNYLINNSLGAAPRGAFDAATSYVATWAERGVLAWEESWWQMTARLGDQVAPLIGARPGEVVFQPNVTLAHAVLFSCFDYRGARAKVVTDAMHFPSILYLLEGLRPGGAEVVVVPTDDGLTVDAERLCEAIDDRTAFVAISHVLFKSSFIHDVATIAERSRDRGALTIVDGYQAVGSIPVDVRVLGVDAYLGGCLKWLCGGPGAAFSWVRPELAPSLTPRVTGWMSHRRPFDFAPELDRRDDAWRFLVGTPDIAALHTAGPGLAIIAEAGIAAIRAKSRRQTKRLIELAKARGFQCNAPDHPDRRGGTVAIDAPHALSVSRALKARAILCDFRPGAGIRLSPHFYNRDEELDEAVAAIAEILESGRWHDFATSTNDVT